MFEENVENINPLNALKGHIWNALSLFLVEVNFEISNFEVIFECYKTAHLKCFTFTMGEEILKLDVFTFIMVEKRLKL